MNEKLRKIFLLFHYSLFISFINQYSIVRFERFTQNLAPWSVGFPRLMGKNLANIKTFFIIMIPGYYELFLRD